MHHAATCGVCAVVVHSLFAASWRGGSPGVRAGEAADVIGRAFCASLTTLDAGDKATPAELAGAADVAIDTYLARRGAFVPDHAAFRQAIAQTIAAALGAAGEVVIRDEPNATRH